MKIIFIACLVIFGIILGNIVHEGIHYISYKGQVKEVCFLGRSGNGVGWVVPNHLEPEYYLSKDNSLNEMWKQSIQKGELFPAISGMLVTFLFTLSIGYNFARKKDES